MFAKARSALEALAVGAAVILCDANGLGPMVTAAEVPRLRAWNLGARMLGGPVDPVQIGREIDRFDPDDAARTSEAIRAGASLDQALDEYEDAYRSVMTEVWDPRTEDEGVRSLIQPLLARVGRLEDDLAALGRPERMEVLSDEDVSSITMAIENVAPAVAAGAIVHVRILVTNALADRALGSWPPFPLQVSYRWRWLDGPHAASADSFHTPLSGPIGPGSTKSVAVRVAAPTTAGRYVLRIVLVQEWWRWLDEAPVPASVETEVSVVRPTLITAIGSSPARPR